MTTSSRLTRLKGIHARLGSSPSGIRSAVGDSSDDTTTGSHAELWLYGVVGGYWFGFNAKSVADQLRGLDVDNITVRLHSPGGNALDGIAIGNLLRNHKARVRVVVDGLAASAASIIAVAGDEVVMSPGSQFMLHDPWFWTVGNAKELRQDADFLDKQAQNMAEVYAGRAGGTSDSWREAMTAEPDGTWYTAQESVDAGLADRVGTVVATSPAPEPPADETEDDEDEMDARAALDLALVHPAALAAWQPNKPPTASADGNTHPEGAAVVDFNDEQIATLREQVGFPADADADTIVAAVNEALTERAEDGNSNTTTTPQIPEGMSLVDTAVLEDLQSGVAAGRQAQRALADQERDRVINQALADGKIAATSREKFVTAWDKDADSTRAILDALTPGLVPTTPGGHDGEPSALGADIQINDAELAAWAADLGLTEEALRG